MDTDADCDHFDPQAVKYGDSGAVRDLAQI